MAKSTAASRKPFGGGDLASNATLPPHASTGESNTALAGHGLAPSRPKFVDASNTGGDKPRPYDARLESIDAVDRGRRRIHGPSEGGRPALPTRRQARNPETVGAFNTALAGHGFAPSRSEFVGAFNAGGDKPRPYGYLAGGLEHGLD